jgi:uncharacterized protein (DUF2147 family)
MKCVTRALASLLLLATPVAASESPLTGEWAVEEGLAHIRVENCGGRFWGVVAWEKKPGVDRLNPDQSKRRLPTLGMPVLLAMKQTRPNHGEGKIYNSENGKIYSGSITLTSPDVLRVEGCVLGFLCGGQDWTRVTPRQDPTGAPGSAQTEEAAALTVQEFCANIARRAGSAR